MAWNDEKMDDNNRSINIRDRSFSKSNAMDIESLSYKGIYHSHNLFQRDEINLYNKTYRFGLFNPYGSLTNTREFLFFTKPDLNIFDRNYDGSLVQKTGVLTSSLEGVPFWQDLAKNRKKTIEMLQLSYNGRDNFNHLLQNQVISNLDIPVLTAETIETPVNMYGVSFSYRGSSEASDDSFDFSLEFKDTKWLDTYYFFKAYEEYETLKHHGAVRPWKKYIENKIIHDQFSIYKFLVDEDMETIVYYAKFYGVMPKSLPRDSFTTANFDNGLSYSVDFRAAFFEDMRPEIIYDFNDLSKDFYDSQKYRIDIHNDVLDRPDNRPATAAYIERVASNNSPTKYVYKLRWKGSDYV